ncbi:hypothetical protein SAMN05421813_11454 [Daejeonella rubra]|uniref:Uncharacterized protein n=1 Tax=Daejeonella rubra TaxID=990371 RepID=A0A1G9TWT6_9SPHI|nr:EboA domain-containing protein [Daejeonella rubra]SDM51735.1 hypothetical protein SAMN05421813_11454 [Daejeonella rubra]
MFDYDAERFRALINELTRSNVTEETWQWLSEKFLAPETSAVNSAFAMMPRKTGKLPLNISTELHDELKKIKSGFTLEGWTIDRLGRLCLLLQLDPSDKDKYVKTIENLFLAAEVNELVALYSSLPLFAWAESWKLRCAEGIRSNIGLVLEAIMYNNPYPFIYLDEKAWNQLILKAFFTDKDLNRIAGIDERANAELAATLVDYAHERWAAHRKINPHLWRLTSKFIDENLLNDLKRLFEEGSLRDRQAAALTAYRSDSVSAKKLLNAYPELLKAIENKELNWGSLAPEE